MSVEFLIYAHAEINIRDRWGYVLYCINISSVVRSSHPPSAPFYPTHICTLSKRTRRTPLDDAIAEGHLACAKMLLSFGAEHGIELDDATRARIQEVDLNEVRVMVKKERVRAVWYWYWWW